MIILRELLTELLAAADQLPLSDWLTESESAEYSHWRDDHRARQWLAGRWLAKRELQFHTASSPLEIDISSRDTFGRSTTPRVCVRGRAWSRALSISHSGDHVAVAIRLQPGQRVGIDVVSIREHDWNPRSLAPWFSEEEQSWIQDSEVDCSRRVAQLWAVKEAVYKASQRGEPFIPGNWPALPWLTNRTAVVSELEDAVMAAVKAISSNRHD